MSEYCILNSEFVKSRTKDSLVNLVLNTILEGKQILIFNHSKNSSEATAEKIALSLKETEIDKEDKIKLKEIAQKILKSLQNPTKQCRRLASCIERGIAFHHSGLTSKQRSLVEKGFKEGVIRVISSTPTLAAGLNLPAYKVIIKDYRRYSQRGFNDIPVLEYHQMSGRAGRPGSEEIGKAVLYVKSQEEAERVVPKYVFGKPEEIISKLAVEPTLKMYMLSLISMNMINTKEEIKSFFVNTLYAHQYKDLDSLYFNIFRILGILKDYDFINQEDDYYISTQLGKKVSELYLNPDTAHYFIENIDKFFTRFSRENITKYDVYDLLHFIVNTVEMKPLFRVAKIEEESYVKKLEEVGESLVAQFNPFEQDYVEFINSLKTSDVFLDWILEAPEDYISEKYKVTPGELNFKIETMDWLLYCLEEMAVMKKNFFFKNFISKLRIRFKFGIKEELIPLVSLKGIGRVRARNLYKNGFKKLVDLKKADFSSLARVVGDSIAIKIKGQVSDNIDINDSRLGKPYEIKVRREVTPEEVEELVSSFNQFEKDKEEKNKNLNDFF